MPAYRVVLVRHGESRWNREGRFQGHGGTGLTELGHAQATAAAAYLARREAEAVGVVCSDLQRVAETAEPALAMLSAPVTVAAAWREIDVGWWSGHTHADVAATDPDGYTAWRDGQDRPRGGGETYAQLRQRVHAALDTLVSGHPPGTVLVFTHGGPIQAAAGLALGLAPGPRAPLGDPSHCSLTTLVEATGGWLLASYNETAHLGVVD